MSFVFRPLARAASRAHSAKRFASTSATSAAPTASRGRLGAAVVTGAALTLLAYGTLQFNRAEAEAGAVRFPASSGKLTGERIVSLGELEKHTHTGSLWVVIDSKVYDVTNFAKEHPGGSKVLLEWAGKDVSKLFWMIHPGTTLEKHEYDTVVFVGKLDDDAVEKFAMTKSDEDRDIEKAKAALFGVDSVASISDFERYAKDCLSLVAWAYFSTGADSEDSLSENAAAYTRVFFRPRIMRNVQGVDASAEILGYKSSIPVYVSPTARNGWGNPEGEVAVAKGAGAGGILQVLSHYASRSLEEVKAAAREGQEIGWQLYLSPDREKSAQAVRDAVAAGAHSIWITADTTILGKREVERRMLAEATPTPNGKPLTRTPVVYSNHELNMSWDDINWVKKLAPGLPVVIKGVGAWEDVEEAYKAGADAVVLSNHGGRQLNFAEAPLKTLADVNKFAPQVLGQERFSIFVDGGIRHGTDVLKAVCLGARGVGLGRPFIYAATGWGAEGVEKAIMILREEIEIGMALLGVTKLDQLGPQYVDTSKL